MRTTEVPDIISIEQADDAVLRSLDALEALRFPSPAVRAAAMYAVADNYLVRALLWLEIVVGPNVPNQHDLQRALHVAATADRRHAAHWRSTAKLVTR